jgi:transcriptional regulator with XRE-family HTH domain
METEMFFAEFVNLLSSVSGLQDDKLSTELKVSRQTLGKWRAGKTERLKPNTIYNIREAMERNDWGISLVNVRGSKIVISQRGLKQEDEKDAIILKLLRENFDLKEQIAKLKAVYSTKPRP